MLLVLGLTTFKYFTQSGSFDASSTVSRSVAAEDVQNICSITINSDDELVAFKDALNPTGLYKFTELTNKDPKWFEQACQSRVKCDVLIISGHFGGTFFGKSQNHLSLIEMEKQSCSGTCQGILSAPKEVYLFGCNTLASKNASTRTPEEYLRVLLEDGISRSDAERMVEARYGPAGEDILNKMMRSFPGVPVIYGFCDKAPLGEVAGPLLRRYLKDTSHRYYDTLANLGKVQQNQPYTTEVLQSIVNGRLAQEFKNIKRCFVQTPGVAANDAVTEKICKIRDVKSTIEVRADKLHQLLNTPQSLSYIELANDFLTEMSKKTLTTSEQTAVAGIKNNPKLREDILHIFDKLSFFMSYEYAVFASYLGADKAHLSSILTNSFVKTINQKFNREEYNMIYDLNYRYKINNFINLNNDQLTNSSIWQNGNILMAIGLTATNDVAIVNRIKDILRNSTGYLQSSAAYSIASLNQVTDDIVPAFLAMLNSPDPESRVSAVDALRLVKDRNEAIINGLVDMISRETVNWNKKRAILFFVEKGYRSAKIDGMLTKLVTDPLWESRYYSVLALQRNPIQETYIMDALVNQLLIETNLSVQAILRQTLKSNKTSISSAQIEKLKSKHSENSSNTEYDFIFR